MQAIDSCLLLFLLLFLTCSEVQSGFVITSVRLDVQPGTEVDRGSHLNITCTAKVSHGGGYSPKYTYTLYKDYKPAQSVQSAEKREQVIFSIPQARALHSGTYYCQLSIEEQKMESNRQDITVRGLQTPMLSVDKLVVREGESVMMNCSAVEEEGTLSFSFKDGQKEVFRTETSSGHALHNLTLTSGGTTTLSCSYTLNLPHTRLQSNTSNLVSVQVQEVNIKPTIRIQPSSEVIEGDTVHISCTVNTSDQNSSSFSLQLIKGPNILQIDMKKSQYSKTVLSTDSGEYECNSQMRNIRKTASTNLTVRELFSKPLLTISPAEVFERQQFRVSCRSSSFSSERIRQVDVKYSIYRNGEILTPGAFDGSYTSTAGLKTDGNYSCLAQAKTIIKHSLSHIFTAKVLVSTPSITVVGQVVLGRPFRIRCLSEKGSFPITYSLRRRDQLVNLTQVTDPHHHAIFSTSLTSEQEIQDYRCEAQNSRLVSPLLSQSLSAPVIVPVGKTLLTVVPEPDDVTEGQDVMLICSVSRGSVPVSFRWFRSDSAASLHTSTESRNFSIHTLHSVSGKHTGSYHCEALNDAGVTQHSSHVTFTVKMAVWKKALIAGVSVLCLSVVLVVLLIRYRSKRGVGETDEMNVEYTEVLHPQADPTPAPLKKGTDTVYSELQTPPPQGFGEVC